VNRIIFWSVCALGLLCLVLGVTSFLFVAEVQSSSNGGQKAPIVTMKSVPAQRIQTSVKVEAESTKSGTSKD
jgi:hypothetical protein